MKCFYKMKYIILNICIAMVINGCTSLVENETITPSIPENFTPEPTPEGQWAGLAYEAEGWELITYEGYEKTNIFPAYMSEMQILIHPNIEGCELTYWFGGAGYDSFEWDVLDFEKKYGDNEFHVAVKAYQGKLVQISYGYKPEDWGTFRLRFGREIEWCVVVAERLLSTLDPAGLEIYGHIHVEREVRRQTEGIP
jgi:hypothetical protein